MFRTAVKFAAFFVMTLAVYSLWLFAPLLESKSAKRRLREFVFKTWARAFVRIAGARIKIVGAPPKPPFVLVSNHLSYFDIAALRANAECVFVAKADIADWFAAGKMIGEMKMIFVDRKQKRDVLRVGQQIIETLASGEAVTIFPEGTTSDGQTILPFKSALLEFAPARRLPIYYASISYKTAAGAAPASEAICWWRAESDFVSHLWRFFELETFDCTVAFGGEPVQADNRKTLADKLRAAVLSEFEPVNR